MTRRLACGVLLSLALVSPLAVAAGSSPSKAAPVAEGQKHGALGDLGPYLAIAKDTLKLVEANDLKAAKERIRDLESAWDVAEDKMRPMSPTDWETADKAIDRALAKLRAPNPAKDACAEKMKTLIETLESLQKSK